MARILVVGGAGYIGSHTCKELALNGHDPIVFDNLISGHADAVKWGALEKGDILASDQLDNVFEKFKPDIIMHFAALSYVGESVLDPAKYYTNNICGSLNLLEAMRRHGCNQLIFSSTCATYGEPEYLPMTEDTPQNPINPYGFTKLAIERAIKDYANAYGLEWVIFRYFNAAGCDPQGELGERHDPETHAIPLAIKAALGEGTFNIFGTDYPTPDGTCLRDYIHVSDLASAHVLGVDYLLSGKKNEAFNLATGHPTSVRQIVDAVERAIGRPVRPHFVPRRAGDPSTLYADASHARDALGWKPEYGHIDAIVETAAAWFARQKTPEQYL